MVTGPWLDRSPGVEQAGALGVFLEQWPRIADFDEDANHPASTTDSLDAALNRNRGIAP